MTLLIVVLILLGVVAVVRTVTTAPATRAGTDVALGGLQADQRSVVDRYLARQSRHRMVGATFGAATAIVVGLRLYGEVTIGIGQRSPAADVLFCGLAGSIVGALSAETYRLGEPRSDVAIAHLGSRDASGGRQLVLAARALAAATTVVALATWWFSGDGAGVAISVGGLASTSVAEATRRAIIGRRRPLLTDRARTVDATIRTIGHRSLTRLQLASALLVTAWVVSKTGETDAAALTFIRFVVVATSFVAAVIAYLRSSPRRVDAGGAT